MTLLKRMALVIDDGMITKAFYPVFPPRTQEVIAGVQRRRLDSESGTGFEDHALLMRSTFANTVAEHLRRQHAGIGVVARAVIAGEQRRLARA